MNNFITLIFFKLSSVSGGLMLLLIFFLLYFNYVTNIESLFFFSQPSLMMLWYFFRVFFFFFLVFNLFSNWSQLAHFFGWPETLTIWFRTLIWFTQKNRFLYALFALSCSTFSFFLFCFYCYMFSNSYTTRRGCVLWFEWSMWCAFELPLKYSSFFLCNFFDTLIQSHGLEFSALGQGDDFLDL